MGSSGRTKGAAPFAREVGGRSFAAPCRLGQRLPGPNLFHSLHEGAVVNPEGRAVLGDHGFLSSDRPFYSMDSRGPGAGAIDDPPGDCSPGWIPPRKTIEPFSGLDRSSAESRLAAASIR